MRTTRRHAVCAALLLLAAASGLAWHGPGHHKATGAAVALVKGRVPAFFVEGGKTIQHCSIDPDLYRLRDLPQLRNREYPDHFIDLELLGGAELPAMRFEFVKLCRKKGRHADKVGFVPYSAVESTQRLTLAFAEHRKWPRNPHIRAKCLVYAGVLSHYAQDLCMPLHTTIHYDGRARKDGSSPRSGIHAKVDALLANIDIHPRALRKTVKAQPFDDLFAAVLAQLKRSHALVEEVYRLEKRLPDVAAPLGDDAEVKRFITERFHTCARFIASLYLTAWRDSAKLKLPEWDKRE